MLPTYSTSDAYFPDWVSWLTNARTFTHKQEIALNINTNSFLTDVFAQILNPLDPCRILPVKLLASINGKFAIFCPGPMSKASDDTGHVVVSSIDGDLSTAQPI
jgi:hypothetical protein